MTSSDKRLRLFIALDLPAPLRREVARWGRDAFAGERLRSVREESLHVTLAFLGSRPESEVEALARLVGGMGRRPAPLLAFTGVAGVPAGRRPRLFALDAEAPEAMELQAELAERGREAGLIEPDERPFWPHVTVARVRSGRRGGAGERRPPQPPAGLPAALRKPFLGVRITLYRSLTSPAGAEYVPLAQVELPERAAVR